MKDMRKVMDIMSRKTIETETKLRSAKGAIQEAAKLARDRGEECSRLQRQINDAHDNMEVLRLESSKVQNENTACINKLDMAKSLQEQTQKTIDDKNQLLLDRANLIKQLEKEIESKQNEKSKIHRSVVKIKKQCKNTTKECITLKRQLFEKERELEVIRARSQIQPSNSEPCAIKQELKQQKQECKDIQEQLQKSESKVYSLTKYVHELQSSHEYMCQKIVNDHETTMNATREAVGEELLLHTETIKNLKDDLDSTNAAKKSLEETIASLRCELCAEKKNKSIMEKKLKSMEELSSKRTKKTHKALKNICLDLCTNDI